MTITVDNRVGQCQGILEIGPGEPVGAGRPPAAPEQDGSPAPLLSASMIVKDEEETLAGSIASMAGLVDEVVVYDTGSTDRTREVARSAAEAAELPLVLVEGYWDDDFSRARNASLAHCRGTWILVVDADETVACDDPGRLRALLADLAGLPDGAGPASLEIPVTMESAVSASTVERGMSDRIFLKDRCHWVSRLHEQIRLRTDDGAPPHLRTDLVELLHQGYLPTAVEARGKTERNLRIAEAAAAHLDETPFPAHTLISLARALATAGRAEEALDRFEEGLGAGGITPVMERYAFHTMVWLAIGLSRFGDAARYLRHLWHRSDLPTLPTYLDAVLLLREGEETGDAGERRRLWERSLRRSSAIEPGALDDDGGLWEADRTVAVTVHTLGALGRHREAAELVVAAARHGSLVGDLPSALAVVDRGGMEIDALCASLPPWLFKVVLAQATVLDVGNADRVLESLGRRWPDEEAVPAVAVLALGERLGPDRLATWQARLERLERLHGAAA